MRPSGQPIEYLTGLIHELRKQPRETEWLEFKIDDDEPQGIGEYISALSNSATLQGKVTAYVVWGVTDSEHTIVGTHFLPSVRKVGNEELESWLLRLLEPKILFSFRAPLKTDAWTENCSLFKSPIGFELRFMEF
jgi:hypothetical protein